MKAKLAEIGEGDTSIYKTVKKMIELAKRDASSPEVLRIANQIEKKCGDNEVCKAVAAYDWVDKNIEYMDDAKNFKAHLKKMDFCTSDGVCEVDDPDNTEFLIAPKYLISDVKKGDCDDIATCLGAIYRAMYMPYRFRIIAWRTGGYYSHVYCEVGLKEFKAWVPSDPVFKKFGGEKAPIIRAKSFIG